MLIQYEAILEDFLALLVSYEDVNAKDDPDAILDLVAPPPTTKQAAHEFIIPNAPQDRNSTCLVAILGYARKLFKKYGIDHLQSALVDARGVHTLAHWQELVAFCTENDAYFTPARPGPGLRPGCGYRLETKSSRHYRAVFMGLILDGSGTLETIDGGGKTKADEKGNGGGYQLIARAHPVIEKWVDMSKLAGNRPVLDWVDIPRAIANYLAKHATASTPIESCPATPPAASSNIPPAKPTLKLLKRGIDISSNNTSTPIDFAKVKTDADFVYIRCGLGIDDVDKKYSVHAKGCRDNALDFGLYHFLYPRHGRPQDGDKQALQFINHVRNSKSTLRPFVDIESAKDIDPRTTGPEWRLALRMFLSTMSAAGITPFVYTGRWFWEKFPELVNDKTFAAYPSWLAAYVAAQPKPVAPWTKIDVWQKFGGGPTVPVEFRGKCAGVTGDVDVNEVLNVDVMRLAAA